MSKPNLYAYQDGRDFYPFRDAEQTKSMPVWSAKIRVTDFDMEAAQQARDLFIRQAEFSGYNVVWLEA